MRIVVAPAGSRGDFQPLLALSVGLRAAGHDVLMLCSPNFVAEADAFGVPARAVGIDVEAYMRDSGFEASPLRGGYELFKMGRQMAVMLIDEGLPLCRGADLIIGSGAQISAPTIADALDLPYLFVAFTPQAVRSGAHAPFVFPAQGMPPFVNRSLWRIYALTVRAVFAGPLNRKRRQLGLPAVRDWGDHFFPLRHLLLAADPELAPPPADAPLAFAPLGSLHLPDERPLSAPLTRFLAAGPPPIYIGFGSMPDPTPVETTQLFVDAARAAGARLILSSGWARFGGDSIVEARAPADDVLVIGPSSHPLLFPSVAAVVHHGGAGTTSAALRAGRPQIVVPHAFDQFQWASWVNQAGLGPAPIPRRRLSAASLTDALREVLREPRYAERAQELAARARAHDPIAGALRAIDAVVTAGATPATAAR